MDPLDEQRIARAIGWLRQQPDSDIPSDVDVADGRVIPHTTIRTVLDSGGPTTYTVPGWTVVIRDTWEVDLNSQGLIDDEQPPRRIR